MCPCPFCSGVLLLLSPLLLFKGPREWLKRKIKKHHKHCDTCQHAEHERCQEEHIKCTCENCKHKKNEKWGKK